MAVKSLKRSTIETGSVTDNSMNAGYSFQDFHHLETIQLGGSAASVSFINLDKYAGEYKHLQIRMTARSSWGQPYGDASIRFNNDSGSNYAKHELQGQGSSVASGASTSQTSMNTILQFAGNTAPADSFGAAVIDILDPFSTTKNKTVRLLTGRAGSAPWIGLHSGLWMSTAATTSIQLFIPSYSFIAGSRFSLYGIR